MVEKSRKIFKRIRKEQAKNVIPPHDPSSSYRRVFKRTHMNWVMMACYEGRWDVAVVGLCIYGVIIIGICAGIFFLLKLLFDFLGWKVI